MSLFRWPFCFCQVWFLDTSLRLDCGNGVVLERVLFRGPLPSWCPGPRCRWRWEGEGWGGKGRGWAGKGGERQGFGDRRFWKCSVARNQGWGGGWGGRVFLSCSPDVPGPCIVCLVLSVQISRLSGQAPAPSISRGEGLSGGRASRGLREWI